MKMVDIIRVIWFAWYFISDSEQSTLDWTDICCHGTLTFSCESWNLDVANLDRRDKFTNVPYFIGDGKPEFVYSDTVGYNQDSYVYRDVDLNYEVILTKSTNSSGFYGQIISNTEDYNYVIEYCGTGQLHGIKKIAKSLEIADTGSGRDAGTKQLKGGMLSTTTADNNTLARNKVIDRQLESELEYFDIKFYYTKSFAKYTVDVNGFVDQVISSLNQAFINSHAHVRARATCTEEAPLSDSDPNLFRSFIQMKGTDSRLKDGAFAAQLLFHNKIPFSSADKRSTDYCNQMDLQDRKISIVEKDCALGFLSSAHAIGHSLGLDDESFSDVTSRANAEDRGIMEKIRRSRFNRNSRVNCYGTGARTCRATGRRVRGSQIKISFGGNYGRSLLRANSYIGVSFCKLTLSEQLGIDTKELYLSLREEVLQVKDLVKNQGISSASSSLEHPSGLPQCSDYKTLTGKERSVLYSSKWVYGVTLHDYPNEDSGVKKSPSWSGEGWYRVQGEAGTRLSEKSQWPGDMKCGTVYAGWMNAKHDDIGRYQTVQVDLCFGSTWSCYTKKQGRITNCSGYFVYYLPVADYQMRYCTVP